MIEKITPQVLQDLLVKHFKDTSLAMLSDKVKCVLDADGFVAVETLHKLHCILEQTVEIYQNFIMKTNPKTAQQVITLMKEAINALKPFREEVSKEQ